jgi:hypothetical protein
MSLTVYPHHNMVRIGEYGFAFLLSYCIPMVGRLVSRMMEWKTGGLSLEEIRETDMVDYLSDLGFEPVKPSRNGVDFYYLSPLRIERDASFHVNRKKNKWFDHGLGRGGNIIDFGMAFYTCTVRELIEKINGGQAAPQAHILPAFNRDLLPENESRITLLGDKLLYAYPLINYLHERHIPRAVAEQFCREVDYELDGRKFYGIGFKNDAGGFEIRNAYVKQSISPKEITTIGEGAKEAHVFEGFMDFLSWKTLHQREAVTDADFIVLNGAAFFEKAREVMERHEVIRLWLDRDTTGKAYTQYALSLNKGYRDESALYSKHKDLNDWLCGKGMASKRQIVQKIG